MMTPAYKEIFLLNNIENTYKYATHTGDTNLLNYSELRKIT